MVMPSIVVSNYSSHYRIYYYGDGIYYGSI